MIIYLLLSIATNLFLALTKRQEFQFVLRNIFPLGQLHQLSCRIRPWTEDEDDGRQRSALLVDQLVADDRRRHVFLSHRFRHVLRDRAIDPVNAEATEKEKALECQQGAVL